MESRYPTVSMDTSNAALELEALDHLRYGDSSIETFWGVDGRHTTHYTKASVFEARDGQGVYVPDLNDDEFRTHLQNDTPGVRQGRRLRIIFLDGDECNADLLPITSSTMQLTHDTYGIANRFSFYLSRQQMAGSSMHYDPVTNEPARMEFWYSVVVRTKAKAGPTESDNSRRVVNWSRCCVWADYDARTGDSTCFAWRYPLHMKQTFLDNFLGPRGGALQTHPMLLHASWMERLCTHTRDINLWFFEPLYEVEHQVGRLRSPADLFDSARSLTSVYRQIRQVLTDYEVFLVSAKSLRKQNEAMANLLKMYAERNGNHKPSTELQGQLHMTFKQVRRELKLGKTYLTLYLERCISGIADMQSVSTQHSAEVRSPVSVCTSLTNRAIRSKSRPQKNSRKSAETPPRRINPSERSK